jgi:hypothetical protein
VFRVYLRISDVFGRHLPPIPPEVPFFNKGSE